MECTSGEVEDRASETLADDVLADDVDVAARRLGFCRAKLYTVIGAGEIDSFTVGRRRKISRAAQRRFIKKREAEERAARELAASQVAAE